MLAGHQKQWNFLKKKFESNNLSHAYLFAGTDQLGKKSLAKEFVRLINCLPVETEPENYPDVLIINQKNNKQEIEISQIREVLNFLSYKPYYSYFKAVIIDGAEKMNLEAQNCLLKTLEEPKGKVILILISSHPEILYSTIRSRCQIIKFNNVSQKDIESHLLKLGAKEKTGHTLALFSQGKPGRAVDLFLDSAKLEKEQKMLQELIKVVNSDFAEKFQYAKKIDTEGNDFKKVLEIFQRYLRHLLFSKTGIQDQGLKNYFPEAMGNFKNYTVPKIRQILNLSESIQKQISLTNANPKLALEILLMEM